MELKLSDLKEKAVWERADIRLPEYDIEGMREKTAKSPKWIHFGAGNIFRGFIAGLQNSLLNEGSDDTGIIAAENFDCEIIEKIFEPFDNLTLDVTLMADGGTLCRVNASIAEALRGDMQSRRIYEIFENPSLQLASFTVTEKGYSITGADGSIIKPLKADMEQEPDKAAYSMGIVTAGLYHRYKAGAYPIAMVSMDNCSQNGDKLKACIIAIGAAWQKNGFADEGFIDYLENTVTYPWSMIDKITPRPAEVVEKILKERGLEGMQPVITSKGSYTAAFVNAEKAEYLVIEDKFPNGRPALEKAGVYMTDRETVEKTERMKVTTCLNPLHTAMSIYGCLLGYTSIYKEMADAEIVALIKRLGYVEGLPVVENPGILSPKAFLDQVMKERLPNPFIPDMPQRIATDTSQKIAIRFGETVKSYMERGLDMDELIAVPLAIAGWFRYLLAVDDMGEPMEVSADPLKDDMQARLKSIKWNDKNSYSGELKDILPDAGIFGVDLKAAGLADKIEGYFTEMLGGSGAVRGVLEVQLKIES